MKHSHHHCQHTVDYCSHCDTCFCAKCDAEWKPPCRQLHYRLFGSPTYYPWTLRVGSDKYTANLPANQAPPERVTVCAHGR